MYERRSQPHVSGLFFIRRMTLHGLIALVILLCLPAVVTQAAEEETRVPVVLRHAGSDPVGLALFAALGEEIDVAGTLRQETPATANPRIVLIVATVDGSVEDPGKQTAASINVVFDTDSLPLNGYLITALVQVCGITRTHECAQEILSAVDGSMAKLRAGNPELWDSLRPLP